MEHIQLERSRTALLSILHEMEQRRNRDEITVENPPDTIERVQRAAERDLAIRHIESGFHRLQKVKLALERIKDGSYGVCLRCDREIGAKRLDAVPWAECCVKCQDAVDRENKEQNSEELVRTF